MINLNLLLNKSVCVTFRDGKAAITGELIDVRTDTNDRPTMIQVRHGNTAPVIAWDAIAYITERGAQ